MKGILLNSLETVSASKKAIRKKLNKLKKPQTINQYQGHFTLKLGNIVAGGEEDWVEHKNWHKKLTLHPFYLFLCLFNVMEEEGAKRQKSYEINLFDNFLKAISARFSRQLLAGIPCIKIKNNERLGYFERTLKCNNLRWKCMYVRHPSFMIRRSLFSSGKH